jgi:hypothetical protein
MPALEKMPPVMPEQQQASVPKYMKDLSSLGYVPNDESLPYASMPLIDREPVSPEPEKIEPVIGGIETRPPVVPPLPEVGRSPYGIAPRPTEAIPAVPPLISTPLSTFDFSKRPDLAPAVPPMPGNVHSSSGQLRSLENAIRQARQQMSGLSSKVVAEGLETISKQVNGQLAEFQQNANMVSDSVTSPINKLLSRFESAAQAFKGVDLARNSALNGFFISNGTFQRLNQPKTDLGTYDLESRQPTVPELPESGAKPAVADAAVENVDAKEISAEVAKAANSAEAPPITEAKAQAESIPQEAAIATKLQTAYEKLAADPKGLTFIAGLQGFAREFGFSKELVNNVLAEKFGRENAEALQQLIEDPKNLEFMKQLGELGLSVEMTSKAMAERFSAKKVESASPAAEEVATAERKESADGKHIELQELLAEHAGTSVSDLDPSRQLHYMGRENARLAELMQQDGAQLYDEATSIESVKKGNKTENQIVSHHYMGDLDNPKAIQLARADNTLKTQIFQALMASQSSSEPDKLAVFEAAVAKIVGDPSMVTLLRADKDGNKLQTFTPVENNLGVSYEKGRVTLKVEPVQSTSKTSYNQIDSKIIISS